MTGADLIVNDKVVRYYTASEYYAITTNPEYPQWLKDLARPGRAMEIAKMRLGLTT